PAQAEAVCGSVAGDALELHDHHDAWAELDAGSRARRRLTLDAAPGGEPVADDLTLDLHVPHPVDPGDVTHVLARAVRLSRADHVGAEDTDVLLAGDGEDGAEEHEIEGDLGLPLEPGRVALGEQIGALEVLGDHALVALGAEVIEEAIDVLFALRELAL